MIIYIKKQVKEKIYFLSELEFKEYIRIKKIDESNQIIFDFFYLNFEVIRV